MSEDAGQEDKTEDASDQRLRQAREEGDVPVARDVVALSGLAGGAAATVLLGPMIRDSMLALVIASGDSLASGRPGQLVPLCARPVVIMVVIALASALGAGIASLVQTGGGIWPELALPKPDKMFQLGKLKRLFQKEMLVDVVVGLVKIVTVGWALWSTLRVDFLMLPQLLFASPGHQLAALFGPLAAGVVKVLTTLAVLAGLDLALTRYRFRQKMKMTKEEFKRDFKEQEGDPLYRSRRRRMHRDLMKGAAKKEVPRADALIVNPTHIAIAIRYRPGEDRAPRVTAKGKGVLAEKMRDLARQHGVPIVENIPLARLLYKKVKVGRGVPAETYKAVAAVLAFVYRVLGRDMGALSGGGPAGPGVRR